MLSPSPVEITESMKGGAKRRGVPVKTLKKLLKKAGLKTTGKKAALTRRAKKAKLVKKGGADDAAIVAPDAMKTAGAIEEELKEEVGATTGVATGARRRSRKSRGFKLF